jgi:hypothetical protein
MLRHFAQLLCLTSLLAADSASAETYRVGPGERRTSMSQVPWDRLMPGDVVEIVGRPEPYRSKVVICRRGTEAAPIVIRGVPGPDGRLPIIDGKDAVTPPGLDFWSEARGVINIAGASRPDDTMPAWITVENLEICNAKGGNFFLGRKGLTEYYGNASAIYVEKGEYLTFRNLVMHDCGNGFFTAPDSKAILVEGCSIYSNGIAGSVYEHNSYTETNGITFQTCRFGPLVPGAGGCALKDRSAGLVVRYNFIDGGNRQLDLVDAQEGAYLRSEPSYDVTYVYGNVLIERQGQDNNQIVHYGGDSGPPDQNRKGPLWFYNNTVVSLRTDKTCLFRLSSNMQSAEIFNNIFYVAESGNTLSILDETGHAHLRNNWIKPGWKKCHGDLLGAVSDENTIGSEDSGFQSLAEFNLRPAASSEVRGKALSLTPAPEHRVAFEPPWTVNPPQRRVGFRDLGAFESAP